MFRNRIIFLSTLIAMLFSQHQGNSQSLETVLKDDGVIWSFVVLPEGHILYTLRSGRLKIYDPIGKKSTIVTGTPRVWAQGQGGLFDVALGHDFAKSGRIYLSYAKDLGNLRTTAVGRAILKDFKLLDWQEIFIALPGTDESIHFGGKLLVEKDGIFLTVGERGVRDLAQKLDNHMGKILHLTLDGKAHPTNPYYSSKQSRPEIFTLGHRNPQGIARHPQTGELWAHEHGPRGGDEINRIVTGKNYGWPVITYGREYHGPPIGEGISKKGMEQPVYHYVPSIAPSGFVIYKGKRYSSWNQSFVLGSLVLTHLNLVRIKDRSPVVESRLFENQGLRIRDVRQSSDDWLYFSTDSGEIFKILPKN